MPGELLSVSKSCSPNSPLSASRLFRLWQSGFQSAIFVTRLSHNPHPVATENTDICARTMRAVLAKNFQSASAKSPDAESLGDFRLFLDDASIVGLVEQAVEEVASKIPAWQYLAVLQTQRSMLTLLTYSYLVCRFASEDIAQSCKSDAVAKYITNGRIANDDEIRAFRRANRPWIEQCLARVISKVTSQSAALPARVQLNPVDEEFASDSPAFWFARRRIELATLFDMALSE